MDDNDHLARITSARARLKDLLATTLSAKASDDLKIIMTAVDDLLLAEVESRRGEWRAELARDRAHDTAITRARNATAENRRAARLIRDPGARTCTVCGRGEGEVEFFNRAKGSPQCKTCEAARKNKIPASAR